MPADFEKYIRLYPIRQVFLLNYFITLNIDNLPKKKGTHIVLPFDYSSLSSSVAGSVSSCLISVVSESDSIALSAIASLTEPIT